VALALLASGAATRAEERVRLTMDDALALLRRQNPEVLAAALEVQAARGDVVTARLYPNPTLSGAVGDFPLGSTNPHGLSVGQTVVGQVGLEQEFLLWGKRGKRIAQARARADAAEATRADLERTLAFTLRSRFTDVLITTRRLALAQENLAHYRETVRVSEARARTGEISPADLDKIMLEQRAFEREVADAEVDRRQAVAELLPLVGLDAADVDAVGDLAVPPVPDDAARLTRDALARRPDLRAAERAVEAADAALALARAEAWPNVTLGVEYTHSQHTIAGDLPDQIGGTMSVPLPVFDRNQGDIIRAEAEALVARHEVAKLRLAIPQEILSALDAYGVARDRVRRFEEAFLREARDARAAAEVSYRAGASSLLEFLEAERAYVETQRDHLDALHDAQVAAWAVMRSAALEATP
jgi:cobalt-zinc-cadmium efflux system outer membrane protein